jgi:phage baseplate assembly protein W
MIDPGQLFGRGISFPPRVGTNGRIAWSEGESNVREAVQVILLTDLRERLRLPDFGGGLPRFLFEPNNVATYQTIKDRITRALGRWEPRIALESVAVDQDPSDIQSAVATITYRLIATQTRERVSLSVALS